MFFPVALDLKRISVLLVGSGELLARRKKQLEDAGAKRVTVFADGALPAGDDIKAHAVIMVTGLPREQAEAIAIQARAQGKLVNVEDVNDLCDFYFTANIRRGDLLIAVSTSGASPTLARKLRDYLALRFGQEWAGRVRELANLRRQWKKEGRNMQEVLAASEAHIADKGWLA